MDAQGFVKNTATTAVTQFLNLLFGLLSTILLARLLGPEGKGLYTLTILLPTLVVTFFNGGIGPSTVYHVAQARFPLDEVVINNMMLALMIGCAGALGGGGLIYFWGGKFFPDVPQKYLWMALLLIPTGLLFTYLQAIFQGLQRFFEFNLVSLLYASLFLAFVFIALWVLEKGVLGAVVAGISAWFLTDAVLFVMLKKRIGITSLRLNKPYLKRVLEYGIQFHLGNIVGFLNYKADLFLINVFLNPAAVGFYSVSVALVEKLWLVSQAASAVLFPGIAAEKGEKARNKITPFVARSIFWLSLVSALILLCLSRWVVTFLYSPTYLSSVYPLQILLPGIVALNVGRILANDIAGRGYPILNTYLGIAAFTINVALNVLWIPEHGIAGAALASSISYSVILIGGLVIYCRLSGNSWLKVFAPQPGDWMVYRRTGIGLGKWMGERVRGKLRR